VVWLLTRDRHWTAISASLFVLLTLSEALPAALLAAFVVWWAVIVISRRLLRRPPPSPSLPRHVARASGIFSVAFLAVALVNAVPAALGGSPASVPAYGSDGVGGPNVYMLLLDGYPRADTLVDRFGIDNSGFEADLQELGFDLASQATSNYNKTWLTLAAVLNGSYIDDLLGSQRPPTDDAGQVRWLQRLISDAAFLRLFRERGYRIRTIAPPITSSAILSADEVVETAVLNEFEANLLWSSPWAVIFRGATAPMFLANHEASVMRGLREAVAMARNRDGPQLVIAHIHSPHPPFALHRSGDPAPAPVRCFPAECSLWQSTIGELSIDFGEYRDQLRDQLVILNEATLDAVQAVVEADPMAVVIVFSDHGLRYSLDDTDEQFRSFLAARTPGIDQLFPDDETAVNILRRFSSAYWGTGLAPLPARTWWSDWTTTLDLSPYKWLSDPISATR
jgi:hypothetical protein